MATIVEIAAGDRRLRLQNEEYGRTFAFGTNWSKLRVCIRVTVQTGPTTFSSQGLIVGVCQGTANMWGSASCTDFIGGAWGQPASAPPTTETWTFDAGNNAFFRGGGSGFPYFLRKVNATITSTLGGAAMSLRLSAINKFMVIFEIQKYATYVGMAMTAHSGAASSATTDGDFLLAAANEIGTGIVPVGHNFAQTNFAYTGSAPWDSVNIVWDNTRPYLDIADIVVSRFF